MSLQIIHHRLQQSRHLGRLAYLQVGAKLTDLPAGGSGLAS
jgi:hypothetical protein